MNILYKVVVIAWNVSETMPANASFAAIDADSWAGRGLKPCHYIDEKGDESEEESNGSRGCKKKN